MDCGIPLTQQCGSEDWLFSNTTIQPYVTGTCQNGANFSSFSLTTCLCPAAADISPCTCGFTASSTTTVTITCSNQNLNDDAVSAILKKIFPWSPIDTMNFYNNSLTKIPSGLSQYSQLFLLSFSSNSITSIGSNDLSGLTAPVMYINLGANQISTIADNAFPSWSILHNLIQ